MSILGEFTAVIQASVPASSLKAVTELDRGLQRLTKGVENFVATSAKGSDSLNKVTSSLAASWKSVGIAVSVASAAAAGIAGMTVHAGKEANALKNFSDALGLNAEDLALWSAAVNSAGLDAKAFENDLQALKKNRGSFTFDDVLQEADKLHNLELPKAIDVGATWGWSAESVQFLHQGSAAILAGLQKSRELGHGVMQKHIEDLQAMHRQYKELSQTVSATVTKIAGELAPSVGESMDKITQALAANQSQIVDWVTASADSIGRMVDVLTGNVERIEDLSSRISSFNGEKTVDNLRSDDPNVRQAEMKDIEGKTLDRIVSYSIDYIPKIAMPGALGDGKKSSMDYLGEYWDKILGASEPLHQAAQTSWETEMGDKKSNTGNLVTDWFADYRTYHKLPGGLHEQPQAAAPDPQAEAAPTYMPGSFPQPKTGAEVFQEVVNALKARPVSALAPAGDSAAPQAGDSNQAAAGKQTVSITNNITVSGVGDPVAVGDRIVDRMSLTARADGFQPAILP